MGACASGGGGSRETDPKVVDELSFLPSCQAKVEHVPYSSLGSDLFCVHDLTICDDLI